jgi:hypothetical protein
MNGGKNNMEQNRKQLLYTLVKRYRDERLNNRIFAQIELEKARAALAEAERISGGDIGFGTAQYQRDAEYAEKRLNSCKEYEDEANDVVELVVQKFIETSTL